jgi:hypothetical protein
MREGEKEREREERSGERERHKNDNHLQHHSDSDPFATSYSSLDHSHLFELTHFTPHTATQTTQRIQSPY